jgi:hypothetical protein
VEILFFNIGIKGLIARGISPAGGGQGVEMLFFNVGMKGLIARQSFKKSTSKLRSSLGWTSNPLEDDRLQKTGKTGTNIMCQA